MKFLSFTGPKKDIDRFVLKYLSKYEIHLENALAQLGQDQKNVTPYIEANPYREALNKAKEFEGLLGSTDGIEKKEISLSDAMDLVKELDQRLVSLKVREDQLTEKIRHTEKLMQDIKPFRSLPCPMEKMLNFEEELKKFKPSLEVEDIENAVYQEDLSDMTDILREMMDQKK